MSIATMPEFTAYLRGDEMNDREIIDRWHLACIEWGKGSRGGYPRGVSKPGEEAPGYNDPVCEFVEEALNKLPAGSMHRRIVIIFYAKSVMCEQSTCHHMLAEWLDFHFRKAFRERDGLKPDARAKRWLDRALLTLQGVAPLPDSV
jgi:hypothetical protein